MARILLILPHLPQKMGAPYLGQQYIAASLMAQGHTVRCLDMAAVRFVGDDDDAVQAAQDFAPDIIGMTLFTLNALHGYRLARRLAAPGRLILAGGPHATILPREPLAHGFDAVIPGEGELIAPALAAAVDAGADPSTVPGVLTAHGGVPAGFIEDLDRLDYPLGSYPAFDPAQYIETGQVVVGGMMTSRGCPARCTFCANYVTGRGYRWRSTEDIVGEMVALVERHDIYHFPFWDDAFTARRPRLNALCDAIIATPQLADRTWSCITPGNMVKPRDLERMREAGCVAINFGIESGDYNILKVIQKGQRPENVKAAVRAAKAVGMQTIVNFMFGFPEEGLTELGHTLELMDALAPETDYFNLRGVLVPFPGTAIYDRHHQAYGFTRWWLDPARVPDEVDPRGLTGDAMASYMETDPALVQDFFNYEPAVRDMIAALVRYKAQHNARTIAGLTRAHASAA